MQSQARGFFQVIGAVGVFVQRTPFYYILAADSRFKVKGRHLENLGTYDPIPGEFSLQYIFGYYFTMATSALVCWHGRMERSGSTVLTVLPICSEFSIVLNARKRTPCITYKMINHLYVVYDCNCQQKGDLCSENL